MTGVDVDKLRGPPIVVGTAAVCGAGTTMVDPTAGAGAGADVPYLLAFAAATIDARDLSLSLTGPLVACTCGSELLQALIRCVAEYNIVDVLI